MSTTTLDGSIVPALVPLGSTVTVTDGNTLSLLGAIDNLGTIYADGAGTAGAGAPAATSTASIVLSSPSVTLTGGGLLLLAQYEFSDVYAPSASIPTLVNVDNTIAGSGNIGVPAASAFSDSGTLYPIGFVNQSAGVVNSNLAGGALGVATGTLTMLNAGLMEATAGDLLLSGSIDNAGGTILADGSAALVQIQADDVAGGTLIAAAGGMFHITGGLAQTSPGRFTIDPTATLHGVTLSAASGGLFAFDSFPTVLDGTAAPVSITAGTTLETEYNATLDLAGTISDLGTIAFAYDSPFEDGALALSGSIDNLGTILAVVQSTSAETDSIFLATASVTLGGGGTLRLTSNSLDTQIVLPSGTIAASLTNIDNRISGAGAIGMPGYSTTNSAGEVDVGFTNDAAGIVDATDPAYRLALIGGALGLRNAGLLEATAAGGLLLQAATLDNTGGTILASGAGVVATLAGVDLLGGSLRATGGATIGFTGTSTLDLSGTGAGASALLFGAGSNLAVSGTLHLVGALTLNGGGAVLLGGGQLTGPAGTTVENVDDSIIGGNIGDGTAALSLTNDAAGVLTNVAIDLPAGLRNAGLVQVTAGNTLAIGTAGASTIDNRGGTILASGGTVIAYDADFIGGTLISTAGGAIQFGSIHAAVANSITLDGRAAPLTIAAGTTIQTDYTEQSPPFVFNVGDSITLLGTIQNLGTLLGAGLYSGGPPVNAGLLYGSGTVVGGITNNGTLLAQGGTMTLGSVGGSGSIAIAAGAGLSLSGGESETIDFRAGVAALSFGQPVYYSNNGLQAFQYDTGTLANLVPGDSINLLGQNITSAQVVAGATLAVALTNGATLDYSLANLPAGDAVQLASATASRTEYYNFSYTGTAAGQSTPESVSGSFAITTGGATAGLADVTEFRLLLTGGGNQGTITYDLSSLQSFSASFGASYALTALAFATGIGANSTGQGTSETFTVTSLATGGAATSATTGTATAAAGGQQFSELVVACFAAGTRILTDRGQLPVEALRAGDRVATRSGRLRPVSWTGHRRIDCRRHPRPQDVWPVLVTADAFGPGQPLADLWLSPDHAVFTGGVLIPVRYLANGRTIRQQPRDAITYWHVELDRHDVLLADGLACESYLDTGNRGAFENGAAATQLHADFALRVWAAQACAKLVLDGEALAAARCRLLARAQDLGHAITLDAAPHLVADTRTIRPRQTGSTLRFQLERPLSGARLLSRSGVPAQMHGSGTDQRRLGIAVSRIAVDGITIELDDPRLGAGWHRLEGPAANPWRWSNGAAHLHLPVERVLEIELALTERYWANEPAPVTLLLLDRPADIAAG